MSSTERKRRTQLFCDLRRDAMEIKQCVIDETADGSPISDALDKEINDLVERYVEFIVEYDQCPPLEF